MGRVQRDKAVVVGKPVIENFETYTFLLRKALDNTISQSFTPNHCAVLIAIFTCPRNDILMFEHELYRTAFKLTVPPVVYKIPVQYRTVDKKSRAHQIFEFDMFETLFMKFTLTGTTAGKEQVFTKLPGAVAKPVRMMCIGRV